MNDGRWLIWFKPLKNHPGTVGGDGQTPSQRLAWLVDASNFVSCCGENSVNHENTKGLTRSHFQPTGRMQA